MTTDTAAGEVEEHRQQRKVIARVVEVFKLNPQGLNWGRRVMFLDVVRVPLAPLAGERKPRQPATRDR